MKGSFAKLKEILKNGLMKVKYGKILARSALNIAQSYEKNLKINVLMSLKKQSLFVL